MNGIGLLMISGCVLFTVIGQLILKVGQSTLYFPKAVVVGEIAKLLSHNLTNLYFITGMASAFIASLFWSLAIQRINLAVAYPMMSLSYVLVFLAAYFLFREPVGIYQILGLSMIIGGVWMISR